MQFQNMEEAINHSIFWMKPNKNLKEAFSGLRKQEGCGAGYTWPMHALRDALVWLWAEWHKEENITKIRKFLTPIIERGIEADLDTRAYQCLREDHDSFLIQLAILVGKSDLISSVCETVLEADPKSEEYQYLQAWTGILKYRFLGNQSKVEEQHNIMQKWKPTRIFPWPTKKLVETFVERDYKAFNKILKRTCERQWKWAEKDRALAVKPDGTKVLDVKQKHDYFLWPWVEGAFAKLAYLDGFEITYDSPWLPLDLVRAIENEKMCHTI